MPANPFINESAPARGYVAITPTDGTGVQWATGPISGFYVGGAGNVSVVGLDGTTVTFTAAIVGQFYPFPAKRVNATNTTATLLIGVY